MLQTMFDETVGWAKHNDFTSQHTASFTVHSLGSSRRACRVLHHPLPLQFGPCVCRTAIGYIASF